MVSYKGLYEKAKQDLVRMEKLLGTCENCLDESKLPSAFNNIYALCFVLSYFLILGGVPNNGTYKRLDIHSALRP